KRSSDYRRFQESEKSDGRRASERRGVLRLVGDDDRIEIPVAEHVPVVAHHFGWMLRPACAIATGQGFGGTVAVATPADTFGMWRLYRILLGHIEPLTLAVVSRLPVSQNPALDFAQEIIRRIFERRCTGSTRPSPGMTWIVYAFYINANDLCLISRL